MRAIQKPTTSHLWVRTHLVSVVTKNLPVAQIGQTDYGGQEDVLVRGHCSQPDVTPTEYRSREDRSPRAEARTNRMTKFAPFFELGFSMRSGNDLEKVARPRLVSDSCQIRLTSLGPARRRAWCRTT